MKNYIKKISKILLSSIIIVAICGLIYLAIPKYQNIPKYQIHSVRVDEDYVFITRINTLTGDIISYSKKYTTEYTTGGKKFRFTD